MRTEKISLIDIPFMWIKSLISLIIVVPDGEVKAAGGGTEVSY